MLAPAFKAPLVQLLRLSTLIYHQQQLCSSKNSTCLFLSYPGGFLVGPAQTAVIKWTWCSASREENSSRCALDSKLGMQLNL